MKDQAWIEERRKELKAQLEQVQANANTIGGALQMLDALLAEDTPSPVAAPKRRGRKPAAVTAPSE